MNSLIPDQTSQVTPLLFNLLEKNTDLGDIDIQPYVLSINGTAINLDVTGITISNGTATNLVLNNSVLNNGTAIDLALSGGSVTNAVISNGTATNLVLNNSVLNNGTAIDLALSGGSVTNAVISNGTATNLVLNNSVLNNGTAINLALSGGSVTNSVITNGTATNLVLNNSVLNNGTAINLTLSGGNINNAFINNSYTLPLTGGTTGQILSCVGNGTTTFSVYPQMITLKRNVDSTGNYSFGGTADVGTFINWASTVSYSVPASSVLPTFSHMSVNISSPGQPINGFQIFKPGVYRFTGYMNWKSVADDPNFGSRLAIFINTTDADGTSNQIVYKVLEIYGAEMGTLYTDFVKIINIPTINAPYRLIRLNIAHQYSNTLTDGPGPFTDGSDKYNPTWTCELISDGSYTTFS